MCTLFANLYVLSMWGPHMVYMGSPYGLYAVPVYILYLYDQLWLVGLFGGAMNRIRELGNWCTLYGIPSVMCSNFIFAEKL